MGWKADTSRLITRLINLTGAARGHQPVRSDCLVYRGLVLDHPKSYVGKQLLVRGYLTQNPHRVEFWDDGCERGFLPVKFSHGTAKGRWLLSKLGTYMAQSNRRPPKVPVVYSGTFTDHSP